MESKKVLIFVFIKMKKAELLLALVSYVLYGSNVVDAQIFQKTYGGNGLNLGLYTQQTNDGGFVVAGYTDGFGSGQKDFYLLKLDINGNLQWSKTYGTGSDESCFYAQQTSDSGYVLIGYDNDSLSLYLVKTDISGTLLWSKKYGGTWWGPYFIKETTDNGYTVTGTTFSGSGSTDIFLIKTDSVGDTLWTRTYGGIDEDYGFSVRQTSDRGYIVVGGTASFGPAPWGSAYLIKTDSNGYVIWSKTYGDTATGTVGTGAQIVQETSDKGYIIIGEATAFGLNSAAVYIVKLDSTGNPVWSKTYDGIDTDDARSGTQMTDGGYTIIGITFSFGGVAGDVFFIKTDSVGNIIFSKVYDTGNYDYGYSVYPVSDGGYIISGATQNGFPDLDVYLIKTDSIGVSGCNEKSVNFTVGNPPTVVTSVATMVNYIPAVISIPSTIVTNAPMTTNTLCFTGIKSEAENKHDLEIKIYPNPFHTSATLLLTNSFMTSEDKGKTEFTLYDLMGRKVKQFEISQPVIQINRDKLSDGMYIYKINNDNKIISSGKIIIQ